MSESALTSPPPLTLLYDSLCPMCAAEVAFMRRLNRRGALQFEDIAAPEFDASRYGLTLEAVIGSMHAVEASGRVVEGLEVFREAYARLGLGWIVAPTRWPLIRPIAEAAYRAFAAVRPRLSRFKPDACDNGRCRVR